MKPSDPEETRYLMVKLVLRGSGESRYYEGVPIHPERVHIQTIEEAEPMKRAHWIVVAQQDVNEKPDFVCSSCYCISPVRGYTRYCPNCGALMDEEIERKKKE